MAVRIDQPDDGDRATDNADVPTASAPDVCPDASPDASPDDRETPRPDTTDPPVAGVRAEIALKHQAKVDAVYRAYAIDQGCERVEKIEREMVTPAMGRIEAEDPTRHLAGLEHRLKGKDRLAEKVENYLKSNADLSTDQAFAKIKDAIRYTFHYPEDHYTEGVLSDVERLKGRFEVVDVRNSWAEREYKGVNSRWRLPDSGQVFEVQFHTEASLEAKEATHWAYEKIRSPDTSKEERERLQEYQRQVSDTLPVPPNVSEIPDYP